MVIRENLWKISDMLSKVGWPRLTAKEQLRVTLIGVPRTGISYSVYGTSVYLCNTLKGF
jgi:hypothetical protein